MRLFEEDFQKSDQNRSCEIISKKIFRDVIKCLTTNRVALLRRRFSWMWLDVQSHLTQFLNRCQSNNYATRTSWATSPRKVSWTDHKISSLSFIHITRQAVRSSECPCQSPNHLVGVNKSIIYIKSIW